MIDYRLFFGKEGNGVYISTLDMNRMMQRALKRTGLPIWYSQGFNPHIYCSFPLPLPLGVSSAYEIMDFRLTEELEKDVVIEALRRALPPDFPVFSVGKPKTSVKEVASASYLFTFETADPALRSALEDFFGWPEIFMEKAGKKAVKQINLIEMILEKQFDTTENGFSLLLKVCASQEKILSPTLISDAIRLYLPAFADVSFTVRRTGIYDTEGALFV